MPNTQPTSSQARWLGAAQLIAAVRAEPGITRAAAAQHLGISSGGATELVARLKNAELLDETPAKSSGRGRPTSHLGPHPRGPLVIAAELRTNDWRLALADLSGTPVVDVEASVTQSDPQKLLSDMASAIKKVHERVGGRVRAISVSVAGTVSENRLVQFTTRGWSDIDLTPLTAGLPSDADIPLLVGNDATLAGLAEARTGSARGATTALHLIVAVGIGGTLVVDGMPVTGSYGAAGEYGHIPFGDKSRRCPCGARGCWDLSIDGRALAAHLGERQPEDPVAYAQALLTQDRSDNPRLRAAVDAVAGALGTGIAGLVNLHDPAVVTLGGLAAPLRNAALDRFDAEYLDGLMDFRKASPPPIVDGIHGDDGPLHGAACRGIDHITTDSGLAEWSVR
nr:ROK family transcriptional regulator [Rhodococcus sp. (in: high G+C Gram-positive bacteria)]